MKAVAGLVCVAATVFLLTGASASAAVEFGDTCVAEDGGFSSFTLTQVDPVPPGPIPVTAPSAGVVTKVTIRAGGKAQESYLLGCLEPGTLGVVDAVLGTGSTAEFKPLLPGRLPISGVLEPDADNDGYGDETQDKCPQSAALQTPCPPPSLDALALAGGRAVTVYVATEPGRLAKLRLRLPAAALKRLRKLPPKRQLGLRLTVDATNAAGLRSSRKLTVKLSGRGTARPGPRW